MEVQVSNQDKLKLCFIVVVFMTMLLVRGTFRIYLFNASRESLGRKFRPLALQMTLRPIVAFSPAPLHPKQILIDPSALSSNVQLLTLEQTSSKEYLVRLENIFERKDNPKTATVDLQRLFRGQVSSVRETLLAANIDRPKRHRVLLNSGIKLLPMQIRTFFVTLN